MTTQQSFSKIENQLLPDFRQKIGSAESIEDVKKFYMYTIQKLFDKATDGILIPEYEDFTLQPSDDGNPVAINEAFRKNVVFTRLWHTTDLQHIVSRFTASAVNRLKHLYKHPEKTELKIRM